MSMYICNSLDRSKCGLCDGTKPHNHSTTPDSIYCGVVGKNVRCIPMDCLLPDHLFRIDGINHKTERMLGLLEGLLGKCRKCILHMNGRARPYWTPDYKEIAIVGEAPGREEIETNTPFCGKSGKILMDMLSKYGIDREQCLIINTVNCRPVDGLKNSKPSALQIEHCKIWLTKYFGVLKPKKVLLLGNYALGTILGEDGVVAKNATSTELNGTTYVRSVHPAYVIYNQSSGLQMLENSVRLFAGIEK